LAAPRKLRGACGRAEQLADPDRSLSVRTVSGKPWTLCGSASGLQKASKELVKRNPALADLLPRFKSDFPYAENVGFGNVCNREVDLTEKVSFSNGVAVPINRPDPRVWNSTSKAFEHSVDFGPDALASAPAPAPAPTPADSDQALVIGLAVGGAILGFAVLAGTVLLVKRGRGLRQNKEVPLPAAAVTTA
jgi:hypothetical protein